MTNYSQTYAATITTIVGFIGLYLNKFGVSNSDLEMVASTVVSLVGVIWQLYHRYSKGGITPLGMRK